jgi:hypothetical protein
MGGNPLIYEEDIADLTLAIHDWLQVTPLAATEEGYDHLRELIDQHLEKFSNGYRNYN